MRAGGLTAVAPESAEILEIPQPSRASLPLWLEAWYVVARSSDLRPGSVTHGALAGRPYVLFRTEQGALAALDAHCPHMGAHLRHGQVIGERLRCPLHHWSLDRDGGCRAPHAGPGSIGQRGRPWPVEERFGLVFLYPGDPLSSPPPQLPAPEAAERYAWTTGRPVALATDWHSMMVNGFDLTHLRSVHHRSLLEEPELIRRERTLELRYVSRVTPGGGLADWVMKKGSGDHIRVRQVCHGPIIAVESDLSGGKGGKRTAAVLGLLPEGDRVRAFGAFGTQRRGPLAPVELFLARWLFLAFLRKDFAVVEGMRLRLEGVDDEGVQAIAAFLRSLPEVRHV